MATERKHNCLPRVWRRQAVQHVPRGYEPRKILVGAGDGIRTRDTLLGRNKSFPKQEVAWRH